jgi:hypothetical protein
MITSEADSRPVECRTTFLAFARAAALAIVCAAFGPGTAMAGAGHRGSADVTVTRWATTLPADPATSAGVRMTGVVGGDVGRGRYVGKILDDAMTTQPKLWLGHARYGFHGRMHSFVADLHITENDGIVPVTATVKGIVTRGWLKGAYVTGQYRQLDACPIPTPGTVFGTICFKGTLHLQR